MQRNYFRLSRGTNRKHIIRAALESILLSNVNDLLTCIKNDCNITLKNLYVDGGATNNDFFINSKDREKTTIKMAINNKINKQIKMNTNINTFNNWALDDRINRQNG